jgi:hypothetical protein
MERAGTTGTSKRTERLAVFSVSDENVTLQWPLYTYAICNFFLHHSPFVSISVLWTIHIVTCSTEGHRYYATLLSLLGNRNISMDRLSIPVFLRCLVTMAFGQTRHNIMKNDAFWDIRTPSVPHSKHHVSATESSLLVICKIWGFHGDGYEEVWSVALVRADVSKGLISSIVNVKRIK